MNNYEKKYRDLLQEVYNHGTFEKNRTEVYAYTLPGMQLKVDMALTFPILELRKMFWKNVVAELLWLLNGESNLDRFHANNVHMWDQWANSNGDLGPVYGVQLRNWMGRYDQWPEFIRRIESPIRNRRALLTLWDPLAESQQALPPCYHAINAVVTGGALHLVVAQRSADLFVGVPYDMALFGTLLLWIAKFTGLEPGTLTINFADCHIYSAHEEQVECYLLRNIITHNPWVQVPKKRDISELVESDFILNNYSPLDHIVTPVMK